MKLRFTKLTLNIPNPGGKMFLRENGEVVSRPVSEVVEATACVTEADDIVAFASMVDRLKPGRDILVYGVPNRRSPDGSDLLVLSELRLKVYSGALTVITRSEKDFDWPTVPGIFMIDADPRKGAHGDPNLDDKLGAIMPGWSDVRYAAIASSSSYIYDGETEVRGLCGQRRYFGALEPADIPRAGAVLMKRAWLSGFGHILITENGNMLERCLVDCQIYQKSRIDYAAGATCFDGIEQRRGPVRVNDGSVSLVDTRKLLPDLTAEEEAEYKRLVAEARKAQEVDAELTRAAWAMAREEEAAYDVLTDELGEAALAGKTTLYRILNPKQELGRAACDALPDDEFMHRFEEARTRLPQTARTQHWEAVAAAENDVILPLEAKLYLRDGPVLVRDLVENPARYDPDKTGPALARSARARLQGRGFHRQRLPMAAGRFLAGARRHGEIHSWQ